MGVFVVDCGRRVCLWNRWLAELTGITEEAAIGNTFGQLFPGADNPRFDWGLEQALRNSSSQLLSQALNEFLIPISATCRGRNGPVQMQQQVHIRPLRAMTGERRAAVYILDVTENVVRSSVLGEVTRQLRKHTNHDPLTGAFNRRFMRDWLANQLMQAQRRGYSVGCLAIDLDHFKKLNDTYGHLKGDVILQDFTAVVARSIRTADVLVRYGGDEFLVLLPYCEKNNALACANRIMTAVQATSLGSRIPGEVTCSIGVAVYESTAPRSAENLLEEADYRLYQAKSQGRSKIVSG